MRVATPFKYTYPIILTGIFVIFIALMDIAGWLLNVKALTSVLPGHISMHFNTAICFVLLSSALLLHNKYRHRGGHMLTGLLSLIVLATGISTIIQGIIFYNEGIMRMFLSYTHSNISADGHDRMSPLNAICFSLMATGTFGIGINTQKYKKLCQYTFHIVTLISFVVILGYIYNVPSLYRLSFFTTMAFYTAIAFLLLSVSASLINPSIGITAIFTGNKMGNAMARRLFSQILIAVIIIGYMRIMAHRYHWFSAEVSIAFLLISFIMVSLFLISKKALVLNKLETEMEIARDNLKIGVEAAPYALVLANESGEITQANFQAEKLYGYRSGELLGKNIHCIIPRQLHEQYTNIGLGQVTSFGPENDIYAERKNGSTFPAEIILTPIVTQNGISLLASVKDITTRKTNEDIINKQLIELQLKNQELEHFNYIASHDLQEPLRTVSNYIMLLEEDYPEQMNDEIKTHLGTMNSAVSRMSLLVRSLLDFGRLGKNKTLSLINCQELIANVVADLNGLISKNNATITVATALPILYGYETEMRQLFQNLINNAVKFAKKDVAPQITIGCQKIKGYYEFYVEDNGIGIEPKYFNHIFHIFQRLNKNEEYEGYGIGLANCRKIAEMHGGKIWVESEPDKGSTFKFTVLNFKP
ncbi:PAS domain S-box protein [Flavobacterium sp. Sd200]|uniref:sensor histidine kinase n=1 Tax=Flavobacterium sp. Sd200 TaxID=2692211 RepID=UPI00137196B6|nr:PAS domain-containing sensor histidine kinase [Flavobacterium sp. Sd200]MXN92910.1 PAS domain S-box protein [Flavobacterium sp. Sd200]